MSQPKTKTSTPTNEKGSSVEKSKELRAPSPAELRSAVLLLSRASASNKEPDPEMGQNDITLSVHISLRIGREKPLLIDDQRTLHGLLENPGLASAPEEFEGVVRQILLPCYKSVQRATSSRMRSNGDATEEFGFSTLPSP